MKKYKSKARIFLFALGMAGIIGCGGKQRPWTPQPMAPSEEEGISSPEKVSTTDLTFAEDIKPLFKTYCDRCHGRGNANTPKIKWTNYNVVKDYVDSGLLYERIWTLRDDPTKAMPLDDKRMNLDQRQKIVEWIEGGSPE